MEIERIRNDTQICDGLKNIQISFVQTLISRAYEKIEEERIKTPKNSQIRVLMDDSEWYPPKLDYNLPEDNEKI